MLLKLLPAVPCGVRTNPDGLSTFNRSVDRLITFQKVRSMNVFWVTERKIIELKLFLDVFRFSDWATSNECIKQK